MAFKTKDRSFLKKLLEILENQEYQHIIEWNENGTKFLVHSKLQVEQIILPIYFKHNSYQSFLRQLNKYGFKMHKSKEIIEFCHANFSRHNTNPNQFELKQGKKDKLNQEIQNLFLLVAQLLENQKSLIQDIQILQKRLIQFKKTIQIQIQIYNILCNEGQLGGGMLFKFIMKFLKSIVNKDFRRYLSFQITNALEQTEEYWDTDPNMVVAKYDFKKEYKIKHEPLNPNAYILPPDMFKPFGQYQPIYFLNFPQSTKFSSPNYSPLALMYKLEGEKDGPDSEVESY
ncbi:hypothetical protein pb186bvf_006963 [Paramecium bursaria]